MHVVVGIKSATREKTNIIIADKNLVTSLHTKEYFTQIVLLVLLWPLQNLIKHIKKQRKNNYKTFYGDMYALGPLSLGIT